ncbi:probable G-protein coupled receptor 139 [Rhincodon typus]|uniref:probable G-protein coupled receptor 139 n=1 Tax=Rhincodon typus TaxID=259920 RepID=UPI00202DCC45|nr:probable G-protein coupled receptor 139 [Rhincodon typus]
MAVTDLLVIITAVIINRVPGIYFPDSYLSITHVCSLNIAFIHASRDSSVWLTVAFTFDRFLAICVQKLKRKYFTDKITAVIIGMVSTLGCLKSVPWYFVHEPIYIINNIPWYCKLKDIRYTSLWWTVFDWSDRILTPCLSFFLIFSLNVLTVKHILLSNRARKRLRVQDGTDGRSDPEMESRRKSIVLLFAISGSFMLLWMTYVAQFFYDRFTNNYKVKGFSDPKFILREIANMLQLLSCCTNTFIYVVTQRNFREQLQNILLRPLKLIK